jgi:hypothetical protein
VSWRSLGNNGRASQATHSWVPRCAASVLACSGRSAGGRALHVGNGHRVMQGDGDMLGDRRARRAVAHAGRRVVPGASGVVQGLVAAGRRDLDGGDPLGRSLAAVQNDIDVVVPDLGVAVVVAGLLPAEVREPDDAQRLAVDVVGLAGLGERDLPSR